MRSLLWLGLLACTTDRRTDLPVTSPTSSIAVAKPEARFVATIREVAAPYQKWGRVDSAPNIAPMMCDMPGPEHPAWGSRGRVHLSEAADAPHGTKLYYLWASDRAGYLAVGKQPVATGFTIVKESFAAKPIAAPSKQEPSFDGPPLHAKLRVGETWMTTGEAKGLYVMTKLGTAEGTDAGWIYGTITPGGTVTSAGRVASCIGCHEAAPHDRLFGPKSLQSETHGAK